MAQYPLHYANHAPAKFEVAMCKMHLQAIHFLVNASPKPLEIQCMSPTCMHLYFFKFEVAATSNLKKQVHTCRCNFKLKKNRCIHVGDIM